MHERYPRMKTTSLILAFLVVLPTVKAADTGLYELSDDFRPIKRFQDRIERVALESRSNDNTSYSLSFCRPEPFSLRPERVGLVVGDQLIRFPGLRVSSFGGISEYSLSANVDDTVLISQIVDHFDPKIQLRRHPGHQMVATFHPENIEFLKGAPVNARLQITNVGDADFHFIRGHVIRSERDNRFAFSARLVDSKMLPDIGDSKDSSQTGVHVTLKPGESHEILVNLKKWFSFEEPGVYKLRGSYYMPFRNPTARHLVFWEDFACAEFEVKIKG